MPIVQHLIADEFGSHIGKYQGRLKVTKKKEVLPDPLEWPGRQGRGARDPFNSALNYGYGILYSQV